VLRLTDVSPILSAYSGSRHSEALEGLIPPASPSVDGITLQVSSVADLVSVERMA